jgi:hypothetical protein
VVTVKNTGTSALPITSITFAGTSPGQFSGTQDCGTSLAVGASCTISLEFEPTATGNFTAGLDVNAGGGRGTQTVVLSGTGINAPYTVSPRSLAFGSVPHGTTSGIQVVTVHNTRTVALPITSITFAGTNPGEFSGTQDCGTSLAAGASCTVDVDFQPTTTGNFSATLNINAGGGAGTQTVALSGTGT